jgi:hypothetical protein
MNYLNDFVMIYLNDIIVYSNTKKDHIQHVKKILQRLRETNIQLDVDECEFHITKTKFFEMIVKRDDIKMNFEKVKTIIKLKTSIYLKELQVFLNFINFYKRFMKNFSRIIKSLINLIKKKRFFVWNNVCQKTFDELKKRIIKTSMLFYFSFKLKTFLESNSFDYVLVKVLFQRKNDDLLKLITYFSKTLFFVKCNYEIYDKKLLTIIKYFEQWKTKLQSMKSFINVLTNYKILKYFIIIKKLNRHQI